MNVLARNKFSPLHLAAGDSVKFKIKVEDEMGRIYGHLEHHHVVERTQTLNTLLIAELEKECEKLGLKSGYAAIVGEAA